MPISSSFATVADQILNFNTNVVNILAQINSITSTQQPSVNINITNTEGVLTSYSVPSFTYLMNELNRLNNSIQALYNIDSTGSLIQTTSVGNNQFQKIITVNLNKEPNPINTVAAPTQFVSNSNWFFDNMLNPSLSIDIDLSGQVDSSIRKCLFRRYIASFQEDSNGNITPLGQAAANSFNQTFIGSNSIDISEYENWYQTTPGTVNPQNLNFEERVMDLLPNVLLFDGVFNVISIEEDTLNNIMWYYINTLDYLVNETLQIQQLAVNDQLIINQGAASTIYQIVAISSSDSNYKIQVELVSGFQPIPVGIGTLKIYSPVVYRKRLRVDVGYNEYNIVFLKPLNAETNLMANDWSQGVAFYTNNLTLNSTSPQNGINLQQYYINYVSDYGELLEDLAAKKIPNKFAVTPNVPVLDISNFEVLQTNSNVTTQTNSDLIAQKASYTSSLKSDITSTQAAINTLNTTLRVQKFTSTAAKAQAQNQLTTLTNQKNTSSQLLASTAQDIVNLSNTPSSIVSPKYQVKGFWSMPSAVVANSTQPQQVIQFIIQYRTLGADGTAPPVDTFQVNQGGQNVTAAFSNWIQITTPTLQRTYDASTGTYTWVQPDITNADQPTINQLAINIQANEQIQIRIASVSEVGWPESPVISGWSQTLTVPFPSNLTDPVATNNSILQTANNDTLVSQINSDLTSRGLDTHLSEQTVLNNITFLHQASSIISGFPDANGVMQSVFTYLQYLTNQVVALQNQINQAQGILSVIVYRTNQAFTISNNSETTFNIECENYLTSFTGTGIPTGRVYANNIYTIKDFVVQISNSTINSSLGLLSSNLYLQTPNVYNTTAPQVFWVNTSDELQFSDISGISMTQLDNQYLWQVNFDTVTSTNIARLSEDIGNNFIELNNNSLTNILSLSEYNLGYAQNSPLAFVSSNNSLTDSSKWIDTNPSVGSTTKLLSTIHPLINNLTTIVETNSQQIYSLEGGVSSAITIPINIYFKVNALDNTQSGLNYQYVNFNNITQTVAHNKGVKFYLQTQNSNNPFVFTLFFNLNRCMVTFAAQPVNYNTITT